jgi:hypothetical protein
MGDIINILESYLHLVDYQRKRISKEIQGVFKEAQGEVGV